MVVGGGLAGILTALLLARRDQKVTLVESSPKCGGLLQTHHNDDGVPFDYGAHIPKEIGIPGLDQLLFGNLSPEQWQRLDRLRVGGFFQQKLYPTSQFIDLRQLPEETYHAAVDDLLATKTQNGYVAADARDHSIRTYGKTITEVVLEPLMQKLYGCPLEKLEPSALRLVGYSRFIIYDREKTHEAKQDPELDRKIGFTTWDDGLSSLMNFYPTGTGIHIWMDGLLKQLDDLGVEILTSTSVTGLSINNDTVSQITLSDDSTRATDHLYWTASPAFLLMAAQQPFPDGITPPEFRSTALANFVFDRNFLTDLAFYYNHDPDTLTYRTTLYSNLRSEKKAEAPFNCTIEIMSDPETVQRPDLTEVLLEEMRMMGTIGDEHQVTYQNVIASPKGFPLPTTGFAKNTAKLANHCEDLADNLHLFGRATGKTHFMHDVLAEIWRSLED